MGVLKQWLPYVLSGISAGGQYALIAVGYTMVYGILRLINFAHGDIFMVAGLIMVYLSATMPLYAALPAVVILTVALGFAVERCAYKPLRQAPRMSVMISAIGVSYLLQNLAYYVTGGVPKQYPELPWISDTITILGASTKRVTVITPVLTLVLVVALVILIKRTKVGMAMNPDLEILKSLNPDYVLSPSSLESDLQPKYASIGVKSIFLNLKSVEGMYSSIEGLGKKFGREQQAAAMLEEFDSFMKEYKDKNGDKESPKVLVLMGLPGSYIVATDGSYVGSLVKLAGGTNIYGDGGGEEFLTANTEDMQQKDPDIILRAAHALPDQVKQMFADEFNTNDIWKHFRAVQNGRVYDLDPALFNMSANFSYGDALQALQPMLYGE